MKFAYAHILTIAGSDSGGGAGIQADLKTIAALGGYGMSAITAITAQNTLGVFGVHTIPTEMIEQQIDAVIDDIGVDAIKIGMLPDCKTIRSVASALRRHPCKFIVLDPVMVSTSGHSLVTDDTVQTLITELFPLATVITPNIYEAEILLKTKIANDKQQTLLAANLLLKMTGVPVLLKGGHLNDYIITDWLVQHGQPACHYDAIKIDTNNTHGTGCTLSAAIAFYLAIGHELREAVRLAHYYVQGAIKEGTNIITGKGHGPLNHNHAPQPTKTLKQIDD